jgi:hypothetical protein
MNAPAISVIMSVYNGERYIHQAIDSILQQTFSDYEFIIINDGSTDRSEASIRDYSDPRIRLVTQPENTGLTRALNHALALAAGRCIARQDVDDVSLPERLDKQFAFLESHPDTVLVGTHAKAIDANNRAQATLQQFPTQDLALKWALLFNNQFIHSSVMFRTDAVRDRLKGYDENYPRAQDFELWSRIAHRYPVANLRERLVLNRRHAASLVGRDHSQNEALALQIVQTNRSGFLEQPEVPVEDAFKAQQIALGPTPGRPEYRLSELTSFLDDTFERFAHLHREALHHPEIKKHRAYQYARAAYHCAPTERANAFRTYLRAARMDPAVLKRVPLPFFVLFSLSGKMKRKKF